MALLVFVTIRQIARLGIRVYQVLFFKTHAGAYIINAGTCLMHIFSLICLNIYHAIFGNRLVDMDMHAISPKDPLYYNVHVEHQSKYSKGWEVVPYFSCVCIIRYTAKESDPPQMLSLKKMSVVICLNNQSKKLSSESLIIRQFGDKTE